MKRAFITGITGQDGSYLTERLLSEGYEVHGLIRPGGDIRTWRLGSLPFVRFYGDLLDPGVAIAIADMKYDEVYHLAAQSHVGHSYASPALTMETNATATARLLDALLVRSPKTRMYFAATSEMFGTMREGDRAGETYPLTAQSPYAASKVAAHLLCRMYREMGLYVVSGISFNHESCKRGANFVTRKLGLGVRKFKEGGPPVELGNMNAMRDWHHARDTVRGMHASLQQEEAGEYVFAGGEARSVSGLAHAVCDYFKVDIEEAIRVVEVEKRPWDVTYLCGDATKAWRDLAWAPLISWEALIEDVCKEEGR